MMKANCHVLGWLLLVGLHLVCPEMGLPQEEKKLAVIPVRGPNFESRVDWELIRLVDEFIKKRYTFQHISLSTVQAYFKVYPVPVETDREELALLAQDLRAELLLFPRIEQREDQSYLSVSLFDAAAGSITRRAMEPCGCSHDDSTSFPLQRVAELLFDAPEIILSGNEKPDALLPPPPTVIEMPTVTAPGDTIAGGTLPEERRVFLPQKMRRKSGKWMRLAIGAALLSGGVIYFSTRGGSEGDGTALTRLDDPPLPPNSR